MDERHGLRNLADVWPVLASLDNLQHIFCGHYHTGRSLDIDGKGVHLTPSTLAQIDALTPDFHIADTRPAWRRIEWDGTRLNTQVYYP
jgi:Icc protein